MAAARKAVRGPVDATNGVLLSIAPEGGAVSFCVTSAVAVVARPVMTHESEAWLTVAAVVAAAAGVSCSHPTSSVRTAPACHPQKSGPAGAVIINSTIDRITWRNMAALRASGQFVRQLTGAVQCGVRIDREGAPRLRWLVFSHRLRESPQRARRDPLPRARLSSYCPEATRGTPPRVSVSKSDVAT